MLVRKFLRRTAALYVLSFVLIALFALLPALSEAALISDFEDTWTDGGTNYLIHGNVTDTSSAADSQLLGLSVGGTDKFYVLKDGTITVTGPIVSLANGDITLTPNGTGDVVLGSFTLDADQAVGAGQDNYVFTYDDASGTIGLEASALSAGSSSTITGDWTFTGDFNVGDPGLESGSIQLNGASYTAVTKINDFGSTPDAELVLHRHSTSDANQLLLVRSHSNDSSHGDVIDTDDIGEVMFGGWNTSSYYLGARIRATVDGTPGVGDMPTSLIFQVAADGTANPTTALTISPDKTATFAGKIYQNGVQSLYNPSATFTGTMVIGDGGGSLSHTSGGEGYYNTFVGIGSGSAATTQNRVTAVGNIAAQNNTGNYVTAIGRGTASSNSGGYVTANGYLTAQNNIGNNVAAYGTWSAQNNTGLNVAVNGVSSAQNNTGDYLTASGGYSAQYNSQNNVTAVGYAAYDTWTNGTSYSITSADAGADTVTVTGHGITIGTYKPLKVSGTGVGGLSNGSVYVFESVDADTLQPLGTNITSSGTATLYANSNDFTNVTALGYNAEPTKDNQVMLGDTNVVEVKTYGEMLDVGGAITARELSSDPADPDEGAHVCWQSDGTGTGDDGDIICKITAGGTTKTTTLVDFSAL